jgi:hypothetical protein
VKFHAALNKSLALLLWSKNELGENDVAIYSGTLIEIGGKHFLRRRSGGSDVPFLEEWLDRILEVPVDVKDTLRSCEYRLSLSVGEIDEPGPEYVALGLKWPK